METPVEGYWNKKKIKLKELFPEISDSDLCFPFGKEKEMIELLEKRIGKTHEELVNILIAI